MSRPPPPYPVLVCEDCVEGIDAQLVRGYALFKDGKHAKVAYPVDQSQYSEDVDVAGRSFHNGRFVQKLRAKADSLDLCVPPLSLN